MTCVAWDGKILAADRMGNYGGTKVRTRKIHKISVDGEEYLVGASGSNAAIHSWLKWLRADKKGMIPNIPSSESFTGLMIDRKGRIWISEWSLEPWQIFEPFHAIGAGRGEALGAMAMGADARKAVMISARFDSSVGLGIDTVSFKK